MRYEDLIYKLNIAIDNTKTKRHRLIIVLGSGVVIKRISAEMNMSSVDLNLLLSEKLLDVPVNKRSRAVGTLITDIIKAKDSEILAIIGYELLFLPELKQDPIRLFEELSKERTVVVFWKGKYENGILTHAEPWHREYREYSNIDAEIIQV